MSHNLNSLKGGSVGNYIGAYCRAIKGNTRSLDYGFYEDSFSICMLLG